MNCSKPDLDPTGMELEGGVPFGKKQLSVTKVDAQTVAKNPRMQKTMQNIQGKSLAKMQANGRTLEDTGYFKLQMTDIVMVEKGGYTSYTFAVLRDQDSGYMENIIVNLYADGTMKTYFVEYDFTEAEKMALINYGNIPSDPKSQAYLMDNLEDIFSNNSVLRFSPVYNEILCPRVSWVNIVNYCPSGQHSESDHQNCAYYRNGSWDYIPPVYTTTVVTYEPCSGSGGGGGNGGGSGNDSSPPNGNPADSTPPNDPNDLSDPELVNNDGDVHTVPVPPKEVPKTAHEKNCEELQDLVNPNKQNIKPVIDFLKTKLEDGTTSEWSVSFKNVFVYDADTNTNNVVYTNEYEPEGSFNGAVITAGTDYTGGIHIHPVRNGVTGRIFSWLDLRTLLKSHQLANGAIKEKVTMMLLIKDPVEEDQYNLYSLQIENASELSAKLDLDWNNPEYAGLSDIKKLKRIDRKIEKEYRENYANLEKYFLERFASYGISLYKGNSVSEYQSWDKLELQNDTVVKKPCN